MEKDLSYETYETCETYEEKIFPKKEMWILGIVIVLSLFLLSYQFFVDYHVIDWVLLFVLLVFIVVMYSFRKLNIKMTSDSVIVKYGFGKRTIPWESISNCYLDKTSSIWYGGFGNRMARVNGKWRDVYNVLGYPRVVLSLKSTGFYKEFVFSTKNPEEVMKIINEKIKKI